LLSTKMDLANPNMYDACKLLLQHWTLCFCLLLHKP
jgi:hypothetical protein